MIRQTGLCLLACLTFPLLAKAEIYNCDGKWTNKPCDGAASKVLAEKPISEETADKSQKDAKITELAKFKRFNVESEEAHGIFVDFSQLEEFCLREEHSVEDCQEKLGTARRAIENKVAERKRKP